MKFSKTILGIIIMVAGTLLIQFGFSESCSGEITEKVGLLLAPLLSGGSLAYYGRYEKGGINAFGVKK